ncbi:MAG: HD family phosphohydrolase [Candidatus Izimaplasma sp.]|nr:HD family phosphohydrolase [Candidatus Izimaplasma bacterium]
MDFVKSIKNQELLSVYNDCIGDIIGTEIVQSMEQYIQHGDITCLDHCKNVSFRSFKVCKLLNLDYKSAARGALLHDFFLYDWHIPGSHVGLHGFRHSKISLKNAEKHFTLNNKEKDIISSHMWPLTLRPPKYRESFVVTLVDKFCSTKEIVTHMLKKYITLPFKNGQSRLKRAIRK